ncbi:MAG TPA: hypothetical protein VF691_15025 [Cytophagaceae bacterium]
MRRLILLGAMLCVFITSNAQKLKIEQLEQMLTASIDEAEESLFLIGYTFVSKKNLADSAGFIYTFSNRKQTIGTAKKVWKAVYYKESNLSFVKYITYDREEFERFRRSMLETGFSREDKNINENSTWLKDNLQVRCEVGTDEFENIAFEIKLNYTKAPIKEKTLKKIGLKSILQKKE